MHFCAAEHDGADALVLAQERYAQDGAFTVFTRQRLRMREAVTFGGEQIANVYRLLSDHRPSRRRVFGDWHAIQAHRKRSMMCAECQAVPLLQPYQGIVSTAKLAGAFDDRLQNRF